LSISKLDRKSRMLVAVGEGEKLADDTFVLPDDPTSEIPI